VAKKLERSPKGVLVFPHLLKPDTKFNAKGEYKTGLRTTTGADLAAKIDALMIESMAEAKADLTKKIAEEKDKEKKAKLNAALKKLKVADLPYSYDEESGTHKFNFKMTATGVSRKDNKEFTQQPVLFDAKLLPLPSDSRIGGGSEGYVSFEFNKFYTVLVGAGVSLRLKGVQITKLVEFGADAAYYGFEAEGEEGETSEETPEAPAAGDDSDTPQDGTEADDL
jgi:ssDNA-binding protein